MKHQGHHGSHEAELHAEQADTGHWPLAISHRHQHDHHHQSAHDADEDARHDGALARKPLIQQCNRSTVEHDADHEIPIMRAIIDGNSKAGITPTMALMANSTDSAIVAMSPAVMPFTNFFMVFS
jgi:hypothetical protein